jgi:hypothetical protein
MEIVVVNWTFDIEVQQWIGSKLKLKYSIPHDVIKFKPFCDVIRQNYKGRLVSWTDQSKTYAIPYECNDEVIEWIASLQVIGVIANE